ncbi:amidophosphoribosyltransferase [Candidatus Peregrinibacteria bacterium]|nr:MAG: amidophosphoribosyltransferase [Candidatus Peregrinibacteria bacterium]
MCGVFGFFSHQDHIAQDIFDALTVLQHRGQDAAGVATCEQRGRFHMQKGLGLVRDVIRTRHVRQLFGNVGIGHTRYPTAGKSHEDEAQPFYVNSPYGIILAHNGNLTNTEQLAKEVFETDFRHLETTSDSEVLLNVFANEIAKGKRRTPSPNDVFEAISRTHDRIQGAYAVVGIIANVGLFAFRDPHGIRPLVLGTREHSFGPPEYAISSESVAFSPLDFKLVDDVAPGEAVFIDWSGKLHRKQCARNPKLNPCLFEFVYLARPDSIIDGISVYKSRLRLGELLGKKIQRLAPELDVDVVIPIPESARTCALELARSLDLKYREGFIKNRYIGRTFIMPGQKIRKKSVRYKLSAIDLEFRGKNVLLVDDSIVRGTTSKEIIRMAREAGAKKVYFASAAPPVRYPNVYGIDMPTRQELVAYGITEDEVGKIIGADRLFYQDLPDLISAAREGNPKIEIFDDSCFSGNYITGDVSEAYLQKVEANRGMSRGEEDGENQNPMTLL